MRRRQRSRNGLLALLLAASPAPAAAQDLTAPPPAVGDLALMGTIPIYWGEVDGLAGLLAAPGHWARPLIEAHYRLRPLDYLSADALAGHSRLLLAQPRGLSAEENVALDAWVRGGGRVLLFADPQMTGHSRFAIGDRRRPQDVALLSPILAHWGLELSFDPDQSPDRKIGDQVPPALPVALAGNWVAAGTGGACTLSPARIVAECRIGAGRALLVADAALLDGDMAPDGAEAALAGLLARAFGD